MNEEAEKILQKYLRINFIKKDKKCLFNGILHLNRKIECHDGTVQSIEDWYEIEIELDERYFPIVKEISNKITKFSEKHQIPEDDMHINKDGTCCLMTNPAIDIILHKNKGNEIHAIFEQIITPYFCYQSCFMKYGKKPWDECSHGAKGVVNEYLNAEKKHKSFYEKNIHVINYLNKKQQDKEQQKKEQKEYQKEYQKEKNRNKQNKIRKKKKDDKIKNAKRRKNK